MRCTFCSDGAHLPINHRQHVSRDGTLTIQNVQRSADEGRYTCDARNIEGLGMTQHVYVHVMGNRQNLYKIYGTVLVLTNTL